MTRDYLLNEKYGRMPTDTFAKIQKLLQWGYALVVNESGLELAEDGRVQVSYREGTDYDAKFIDSHRISMSEVALQPISQMEIDMIDSMYLMHAFRR